MPALDAAQLIPYIEELIAATASKQIEWAEANPSTYLWDSQQPPARISLQKTATGVRQVRDNMGRVSNVQMHTMVFQVQDLSRGGAIRMAAQEPLESELGKKLDELYKAAANGVSQKALDFLKSIVPHPKL